MHIGQEDRALFPMADQVLSEKDQAELLERFEAVEEEEMGHDGHKRYHQLVGELARMMA